MFSSKVVQIFFLSVGLAVICEAAEDSNEMIGYIEECVKQAKQGQVLVDKLTKGDLEGLNHDEKCVIKCALMKDKTMKEDGSFDMEEIQKRLSEVKVPEDVIKKAKDCAQKKNPDPCETAFLAAKCSMELID